MSLGRRSGAATGDGGAISVANDRRRSTGKRALELKERELGLYCAEGGSMTLDFWAAVRVGSGIVVFPRDFDRKANLFHKDRAESSGKADVFRFVFFSKPMSRGGDPLPPVPELTKGSERGGVRRSRWHRGSFRQAQRTWDGKVAAPVEGCLPSPGLLGNHPSAWFYRSPTEIRGTTGRSPYTKIITQRRRLVKRRQCLLLPRVGAPRPAFTAWSSGRRRR